MLCECYQKSYCCKHRDHVQMIETREEQPFSQGPFVLSGVDLSPLERSCLNRRCRYQSRLQTAFAAGRRSACDAPREAAEFGS